jgi:hypothetical protein
MVLKYPEWQERYETLLLEFDPQRFATLVEAVEALIFFCLRELSTSSGAHDERQAIAEAAHTLFVIKSEILGFPGLEFILQREVRAESEPG